MANDDLRRYLEQVQQQDSKRQEDTESSALTHARELLTKSHDEFPSNGTDVKRKSALVGKRRLTEFETQSSAEMQREMMKNLNHVIFKENQDKNQMKHSLLKYFMRFFSIVTSLIFFVVIDPMQLGYSDSLKIALIGGFFTNLIALFIIIFKYVFSPSKEAWEFWKSVRDGVNKNESVE